MDKPAIDVAYVAELARLDLTDEEKAVFQPQDVVRPSMDREEALANAPGRTGDEFLLPKIVEGAES